MRCCARFTISCTPQDLSCLSSTCVLIVFILALAHIGADEVMLRKLIKLILVIAAVQIVFGLLIYVFGSPFADIRNWMLRVNVYEAFISKGSQLAGLYGPPHIFSYLLAAVPVLSVTMYLLERRLVWLGWMLLMLLGLFINAERAAMAALTVCTLTLVWKTSRTLSSVLLVAVVGLGVLGVQQVVGYLSAEWTSSLDRPMSHGTLGERLGETSADEIISRIALLARRGVQRFAASAGRSIARRLCRAKRWARSPVSCCRAAKCRRRWPPTITT